MKEGLKCAAVFIGTVIGAGFATGQEIILYFNNSSPFIALLSGVTLGIFCSLFMYLGKLSDNSVFLTGRRRVFLNAILFICAFITFTAMFSGSEVLITSIFNVAHIGIAVVMIAAVIAVKGLDSMKYLNAVCVPFIIILVAVIFIKKSSYDFSGNYNPLNALAYAGMNIMLGGAVMTRLGKTATDKTIKTAGVASGAMMSALIVMIQLTVKGTGGVMPLYAAAKYLGLPVLAGIIVLLAIFTTMVTALETAVKIFSPIVPDKRLAALTVCLMAYPVTIVMSFENIVNDFYPVVGLFGVASVVYVVVALYSARLNK